MIFLKKEILLLSPEKIKRKIMTFLRKSNSRNQISVAVHHQDTCLIPDLGQEKSSQNRGHQTVPDSKKLHKDLWTNDLKTKELVTFG